MDLLTFLLYRLILDQIFIKMWIIICIEKLITQNAVCETLLFKCLPNNL
jgi:hypothetical protein